MIAASQIEPAFEPSAPSVTVIVPVFNAHDSIGMCLQALVNTLPAGGEIIVIDDASTDGTHTVLEAWSQRPEIRLLRNRRQQGPGQCRNRGLKSALGDIVFFTDADCVVNSGWFEAALNALEEPEVVGVEGDILYAHEQPDFRHKVPCNPFYPRKTGQAINQPGQDYCGANIAFRRQELIDSGGFFTLKFNNGREDTDLGWRMRKQGRIEHVSDMKVTHRAEYWTLKGLLNNAHRYQQDVAFFKQHGFFFFRKGRVLHPQFLLMLLFPPLIVRRFGLRSLAGARFGVWFFCYLLAVRAHIWRGALRSRTLVF